MDLGDAYEFLDFLTNKFQSSWYSPAEKDLIVDRAQMALFNSYYLTYGTSQRSQDALGPFKRTFTFANVDTPGGLITMPAAYMHLLSVITTIQNAITNLPQNLPVPIINEDEKVFRDNSQIIPVSVSDPYGLLVQNRNVQLYPATPQAGTVYYLSRPAAPFFSYTVVSGRVIVYDPNTSTQLEWADNDVVAILVKALSYMGINLSEQDIMQYAEMKDQQNINSPKDKA